MTLPDLINGCFEGGASLAQIVNIRALLRHRAVRGISLPSTAFFNVWGVFNLYYAHLNQGLSWYGSLCLSTTNAVWLGLAIAFGRNGGTPRRGAPALPAHG